MISGVTVEQVGESMMREIRTLDKLVDELARGEAMEKILRQVGASAMGPISGRAAP